ncbi:hypothetical protein HK097_011701 [Rhizophlyctis rosea]|uniref:Alpha/beta hydrolase fold-3 domain-containing protein n=1 Tax=Rhizophlyctis rosea TaxID=64517 RepID=A0AAD5WZ26_9FUNG|nr:hypothetical protein HK097_011701 [Rhizophlyctis rosea]
MATRVYPYKIDDDQQTIEAAVHWQPEAAGLGSERPIALLFHGGGFLVGTHSFIPQSQVSYLTSLGFVVVSANYRLCPQVSGWDGPVTDAKEVYKWCQEVLPQVLEKDESIAVDAKRIVVGGYSCGGGMAGLLADEAKPPKAILDVYGMKHLSLPFYRNPNPGFAHFPSFPPEHINKVYNGPVPSSCPPQRDIPADLTTVSPRIAFSWTHYKNGTILEQIVPDGDLDRLDSFSLMKKLGTKYPPIAFIHGTGDLSIPYEATEAAHEEVVKNGVDSELITVEGAPHFYDMMLKVEDEGFEKFVKPSLDFLAKHVRK